MVITSVGVVGVVAVGGGVDVVVVRYIRKATSLALGFTIRHEL